MGKFGNVGGGDGATQSAFLILSGPQTMKPSTVSPNGGSGGGGGDCRHIPFFAIFGVHTMNPFWYTLGILGLFHVCFEFSETRRVRSHPFPRCATSAPFLRLLSGFTSTSSPSLFSNLRYAAVSSGGGASTLIGGGASSTSTAVPRSLAFGACLLSMFSWPVTLLWS